MLVAYPMLLLTSSYCSYNYRVSYICYYQATEAQNQRVHEKEIAENCKVQ